MDDNKMFRTVKDFTNKLESSVKYFKQINNELSGNASFVADWFELGEGSLQIAHYTFKSQKWPFFLFQDMEFKDCVFEEILFDFNEFVECSFEACTFINCRFLNCWIYKTRFTSCKIRESRIRKCDFDNSTLVNHSFAGCIEFDDTTFSSCYFKNSLFIKCRINFCRIESMIVANELANLTFSDCEIRDTIFNSLNLEKSTFIDVWHSNNFFSNTMVSKNTFDKANRTGWGKYSKIDLQSLALSQVLPPSILERLFGITEHDVKTYAMGMTKTVKLQSVFISYSFNDRLFANRLNDSLITKGVMTFLWEQNAPAGKRLKAIMSENINSCDKVLFIASEHSIKSEACQYELSHARVKQDKQWKTIFIPIHIDDFLFTLQKEEIRPPHRREEYWKNIQDLKEINSLDFKGFRNFETEIEDDFEKLVFKLIDVLRKG